MAEAKKGLAQKENRGSIKHCLLFEICFNSKRQYEAEMDVGAEMVGTIKTNKKGFCKDTINNLKNDWLGGS